jgi:transposase-like protein
VTNIGILLGRVGQRWRRQWSEKKMHGKTPVTGDDRLIVSLETLVLVERTSGCSRQTSGCQGSCAVEVIPGVDTSRIGSRC